jgi:hypothetical protein
VITVSPGKHRMPRRWGIARAALSAANERPLLTDPNWSSSEMSPRPQWNGPPLLPPDHPSAPVPRVHAALVPEAGVVVWSPARSTSPGLPRSRPNSGPPRPPQRMPGGQPNRGTAARPGPGGYDHRPGQYPGPQARLSARPAPRGNGRQDAEQDVAAIRREATAMRQAAEKEAAHLRSVILSLSEQLSQVSAYIRENVASPGGLATMSARSFAPPRPRTRPGAPSPRPRNRPGASSPRPRTPQARPAGQAGPARPRTTRAQDTAGRQRKAMRIAAGATAATFSIAVVAAGANIAHFGLKFFVFRESGAGETGGNDLDTNFLAQQAAAAKAAAHAHTPGKHSAKSTQSAKSTSG